MRSLCSGPLRRPKSVHPSPQSSLAKLSEAPLSWPDRGSWPRASGGGGGSPGRRAGKPRGCAPLRLSQLRSGKPWGLERLGPAEGLNLLGKVRARGILRVGGEGRLAGFIYRKFYEYLETMTTACQLVCFVRCCHMLKFKACLKIKLYLTST